MTLREFVKTHRLSIDDAVAQVTGRVPRTASCYCPKSGTDHTHPAPKMTDEERRQWVLNDEGLYNWARSEGVKI